MAERVGFEPTCRLPDKTLSRRPRYDHFGTSPYGPLGANRTLYLLPEAAHEPRGRAECTLLLYGIRWNV